MANTYLEKTFGSNGTNAYKWTFSAWLKRSNVIETQRIITAGASNRDGLVINDTGVLQFFVGSNSGGEVNAFVTNRKLQDTNGWYHLVVSADSTQSGATNQVKLYINGVLDTNYSASSAVGSNNSWFIGNSHIHRIGTDSDSSKDAYWNGYMSHIHFCDGYIYQASDFGETDATTGQWSIKANPSVTYGTNGYWILKNGNSVTDSSPNSNTWTVGGGTLTDVKDCPDNIFATWNPLDNKYANSSFANGNTKLTTATSTYTVTPTTIGANKGKYYWEIKVVSSTDSGDTHMVGVVSTQQTSSTQELGGNANDYAYYGSTGNIRNNDSNSSYGTAFSNGTIIGVALDLDNNKLYFRRDNNAWENSGDPTSGSTGTGAVSITDPDSTPLGFYFPACTYYDSGDSGVYEANFGNGFFGTSAITTNSGNGYAGAEGSSKFNYQPPTGYSALSTKGLNE